MFTVVFSKPYLIFFPPKSHSNSLFLPLLSFLTPNRKSHRRPETPSRDAGPRELRRLYPRRRDRNPSLLPLSETS